MVKKVAMLVSTLLSFGYLAWAVDKTLTGTVSDSHCGTKHAAANSEAIACVEKCVSGGAKYTLISDGKEYKVEPQEKLKGMGGQSVKVSGKVQGDTISVTSVEPNAPPST